MFHIYFMIFVGIATVRAHSSPERTEPPPTTFIPRRGSATYEILTRGSPFRNRKLMRAGVKSLPNKETIMLDVGFVALGCAVLALMGLYALTLRQL
jgi:hypothetical protein